MSKTWRRERTPRKPVGEFKKKPKHRHQPEDPRFIEADEEDELEYPEPDFEDEAWLNARSMR
jgi:hypothetical protein